MDAATDALRGGNIVGNSDHASFDHVDILIDTVKRERSDSPTSVSPSASDMAAAVASGHHTMLAIDQGNGGNTSPSGGVAKRYRPAPAKTFQCRGYGDCRMVFSRSEHLARHIRKHTGERPFTCHCGKQFSRLDNLRQHAQTVHSDKQEENERMMKELASLHASMTAANRVGNPRGKRAQAAASVAPSQASALPVKQEGPQSVPSLHPRPGTSTGYEGSDAGASPAIIYPGPTPWHLQSAALDHHNHQAARAPNNHSFRDQHHQSFRAPQPASSIFGSSAATPTSAHVAPHHSFLPITTGSYSFGLASDVFPPSSRDGLRPGSSSSRPPTSGGGADPTAPRTLPPLASVVSSALASQPPPPGLLPQPTQHVLPLPANPFALDRRPSTGGGLRPGTAPAAYYSPARPSFDGGPGLVGVHAELPALSYYAAAPRGPATPGDLAGPATAGFAPTPSAGNVGFAGGYDDSPFSFHPPGLADSAPRPSPPPLANPRKRPFPGSDDGDDGGFNAARPRTGGLDEYGSDSRPQSRRLSVMELCNDTDADPRTGVIRPVSSSGPGFGPTPFPEPARPDTSASLVTSASALALRDPSPPLFSGASPTSAGAAAAGDRTPTSAAGAGGGGAAATAASAATTPTAAREGAQGFGGRVYAHAAARRRLPTTSAAASAVFSTARAPSASPPLSTGGGGGSSSSRSSPRSPPVAAAVQPASA